jgi:hypothetical protein
VYGNFFEGTYPAIVAPGASPRLHLMRVFFYRFRPPRPPWLRVISGNPIWIGITRCPLIPSPPAQTKKPRRQ